MMKRDVLTVFAISLAGLLSLYLSDFGLISRSFLVAFEGYVFLLLVIGSVLLKSVKRGFMAVFSALMTTSLLSVVHILIYPSYDMMAPVAYLTTLLMSFLLNLFMLYSHYLQRRPLFRVYEDSKLAITLVVVSTILGGLFIASMDMMEQFGMLTMIGAALSYLLLLFFVSPLIRVEKRFHQPERISEEEKRVKGFVKRYGKDERLHAFYASWMGSAVSSIANYIDSLEAKGHLGHNFFAADNPFYWSSALLSFFIGVSASGGGIVQSLTVLAPLVVGLALIAPQNFMDRNPRRILGSLITLASIGIIYMLEGPLFPAALTASLALTGIYFAYADDEIISIMFSSFFVGSLYILGYSLWKPVILSSTIPWLLTSAVFLLLIYEYYIHHAHM